VGSFGFFTNVIWCVYISNWPPVLPLIAWHKWHWFHCLVWRWCLDGSVANNRSCWCNWFYPIGVYHSMFIWTFSQTQSHLFQMLIFLFIIFAQFPKLLEVVGLAYTVWFTSRYLLFKVLISLCLIDMCILVVPRLIKFVNMQQSRDELSTKIEELKEQVFGSEDNWFLCFHFMIVQLLLV